MSKERGVREKESDHVCKTVCMREKKKARVCVCVCAHTHRGAERGHQRLGLCTAEGLGKG